MALMNVRSQHGSASRRSLIADGILAAGLAAFLTVGTHFASQHQPTRRPFDAGTIALVSVAAGVLALRRRHPVAVMTVVFGATLLYFILGYANGPIWLTLIVAYFTAIVRGNRLAAAVTAVAGFGIFPWLDHLIRNRPGPSLTDMAGLAPRAAGRRRECAHQARAGSRGGPHPGRGSAPAGERGAPPHRQGAPRRPGASSVPDQRAIRGGPAPERGTARAGPELPLRDQTGKQRGARRAPLGARHPQAGGRASTPIPHLDARPARRTGLAGSGGGARGPNGDRGRRAPVAVRRRRGGIPDRAGGTHERHPPRRAGLRDRARLLRRRGPHRGGRRRRPRPSRAQRDGKRQGDRRHARTSGDVRRGPGVRARLPLDGVG